jgi:hypothetical protein
MIALYSENYIKPINMPNGQNSELSITEEVGTYS